MPDVCGDNGSPSRVYQYTKKIAEWRDARNELAHHSEVLFAKLLCNPVYHFGPLYYEWVDLFPFVYRQTGEEMAGYEEEDEELRNCIGESSVIERMTCGVLVC